MLPCAAVVYVYTPLVLGCVPSLVSADDAGDTLSGSVVDLKAMIQNRIHLITLLHLGTQDVDEVGGFVDVVFGHEGEVEDGRTMFVAHGLEFGARVGTREGFLVDPLHEVAALIIRKEPDRTRARKVDFGFQVGVIGTKPLVSLVEAGTPLAVPSSAVEDGIAIVGFVDDDAKDGRLDDDLVFGISVTLHDFVHVLGVVQTEGVAGKVGNPMRVDDVADLEAWASRLLGVRIKVANRHACCLIALLVALLDCVA